MALCQHNCSHLILEGDLPANCPIEAEVSVGIPGKLQVFQCRHCNAVRVHAIRNGRVAIGPWRQLPYPHLSIASQIAVLAAATGLAWRPIDGTAEAPSTIAAALPDNVIHIPSGYRGAGASAGSIPGRGVR